MIGTIKKCCFILVLFLPLLICLASAEMTDDGIEFTLWGENEVIVTRYTGTGGVVVIPSRINGLRVTAIGDHAFENRSDVLGVSLPEGVRSIGSFTFNNCTSMEYVKIPSTVTSIGSYAFDDCKKLNNVVIPKGVTQIQPWTFSGCFALSNITLPTSLTNIGEWSFQGCSFTDMSFPENLVSIGGAAFNGCNSLKYVNIPAKVSSIGGTAFYGKNLTAFNVSSSNGSFSSLDGVLYDKNKSILMKYPPQKPDTVFTLPSSVAFIDHVAFSDCMNLTGIILQEGLKGIGERVFRNCPGLTSVTIPSSVTKIGIGAFEDCVNLHSITCLSRDCDISHLGVYNATIYGYAGSTAETFALENGYQFSALATDPLTALVLNDAEVTMTEGETVVLGYSFQPESASPELAWTSSDPSILIVFSSGEILAVSAGTATVTLSEKGNPSLSPTCAVTVQPAIPEPEGFTVQLSLDRTTFEVGESIHCARLISGGTEPYTIVKAYYLLVKPDKTWAQIDLETDGNAFDVLASVVSVQGTFYIKVEDASGQLAEATSNVFTITEPTGEVIPGDANKDGSIDIMDLVTIIDYIVSGTGAPSMANADANGDGTVDILDLVWVIDRIVGG